VNHQRHYDKLIERARTRPLLEDYFEFHHVIPRCVSASPRGLKHLFFEIVAGLKVFTRDDGGFQGWSI